MDINKLKYDLAMQCALVEALKAKDNQKDVRVSMLENFKSYYQFYQVLDDSRFNSLKNVK